MGVASLDSGALRTILKLSAFIILDSYCKYLSSDCDHIILITGCGHRWCNQSVGAHSHSAGVSAFAILRGIQLPKMQTPPCSIQKVMYTNNLQDADSLQYFHLDCNNLRKIINCLPMHCRQVPPSRNDKPLPRQHSLAVLTPVTSFPPQAVASWHDWNCAAPVG